MGGSRPRSRTRTSARTRRSNTRMQVELDELATALEHAAETRRAQASPDRRRLRQNSQVRSKALSGGGGNRTRVRGRPEQNVYKHRPRFESRPDSRFATDLPPGQPSCGLTPSAIGAPSVPARSLMPLSRATGRTRGDTLANQLSD